MAWTRIAPRRHRRPIASQQGMEDKAAARKARILARGANRLARLSHAAGRSPPESRPSPSPVQIQTEPARSLTAPGGIRPRQRTPSQVSFGSLASLRTTASTPEPISPRTGMPEGPVGGSLPEVTETAPEAAPAPDRPGEKTLGPSEDAVKFVSSPVAIATMGQDDETRTEQEDLLPVPGTYPLEWPSGSPHLQSRKRQHRRTPTAWVEIGRTLVVLSFALLSLLPLERNGWGQLSAARLPVAWGHGIPFHSAVRPMQLLQ